MLAATIHLESGSEEVGMKKLRRVVTKHTSYCYYLFILVISKIKYLNEKN